MAFSRVSSGRPSGPAFERPNYERPNYERLNYETGRPPARESAQIVLVRRQGLEPRTR